MTTAARRAVSTDQAPPPVGPYSQGIVVGDLLYCAGQGPFDRDGNRVGETIEEQIEIAFDNLAAIAAAAGCQLADMARLGVFLRDIADFPTLNEVAARRLHPPYPVRTTVPAPLHGFDVELDAVFALPR